MRTFVNRCSRNPVSSPIRKSNTPCHSSCRFACASSFAHQGSGLGTNSVILFLSILALLSSAHIGANRGPTGVLSSVIVYLWALR